MALVGRPGGKRPLGKPRRKWEDIKTDLQKVGWKGKKWIDLAQDRDRWRAFVNAAMKLRVPQSAGNFLTTRGPANFSGMTLLRGVCFVLNIQYF